MGGGADAGAKRGEGQGAPVLPNHRHAVGMARDGVEDGVMQQAVGQRRGGGIGLFGQGDLRCRARIRGGGVPGGRVAGQRTDQFQQSAAEIVDQPGWEERGGRVPVDGQRGALWGFDVIDFEVEPGLRCLRDRVDRAGATGGGVKARLAEQRGEDHRQHPRARRPGLAGDQALDLDTREGAVVERLGKIGLGCEGTGAEGAAAQVAQAQGHQAREHAQHLRDLGAKLSAAVADREVEAECVASGPAGQRAGIGREQHRRRRQPGLGGARLQAGPIVGVKPVGVASKARILKPLGIAGQRQVRGGGQGGHPRLPPRAVGVAGRVLGQAQHVVAEAGAVRAALRVRIRAVLVVRDPVARHPVRRRGLAHIAVEDLAEHQRRALPVEDQCVEREVEPPVIRRDPGDADIKEWPAAERQDLMRHRRAHRLGRACADRQHKARGTLFGGQDALLALGIDHRAQHRMAGDGRAPCRLQPVGVKMCKAQLAIGVAGNFAQGDEVLAPGPIGLLHRGERKGVVPRRAIGRDRRGRWRVSLRGRGFLRFGG